MFSWTCSPFLLSLGRSIIFNVETIDSVEANLSTILKLQFI
jgi:hypothetical protein